MKTTNFEYAQKKHKRFKCPRVHYKEYDILIWALPIAPFFIIYDKISKWNYKRQQWSDEKATKVCDYALPHLLDYDEDENCYWYNVDWRYSNEFRRLAPMYLKTWTEKFGYKLNEFIKSQYQKDGYIKTTEKDSVWDDCETWIKFSKTP